MGIRWDAVVERAALDGGTPLPQPRIAIDLAERRIQVCVRLYGALASLSLERSVQLELPANARLSDMLAFVGQRLGESFLGHVLDETGSKRRHCRMFVGGYPVDDLQTQLAATIDPSNVEIILLIAPEGG